MKILVTGATGFLGSHVTRAALEADHEVLALKRSGSNLSRLDDLRSADRVHLVDTDEADMETVFSEHTVDAVIHTATFYGRGAIDATTYPRLIEANIELPMKVLHSAVSHGTPLFVNTDSYFNKPGKTYDSLQGYSLTKKYFHDWLRHHAGQIHVVNMRLEHLYGPGDGPDKFIPTIVDRIAREKVPSFEMTPGDQARDFIYVTDAARAFLQVVEGSSAREPSYEYFEIGSGQTTRIKEVAELIKDLSGSPTRLEFGALPYRDDEILSSCANDDFSHAYGFATRTSISEGLARLIEDLHR